MFSAYTGPLLQGTIDLEADFPKIRWALEKQDDWITGHARKAGTLWGFDQKAAVAQYKHVREHFATGEEIDGLLEAVFG